MGVSRVDYAGETLVDLTGDTVNPSVLLQGETAHGADGEPFEGEVKVITTGIVGEIKSYMGTTPPESFLACDGAIYNIADYPYLAQHFLINFGKTNFFGGDGVDTFSVPDLRGEFLRGSGKNGHVNQGNGANVGIHQNATRFPYYQYYADENIKKAIIFSNSINSANYPDSIDGTEGKRQGSLWLDGTLDTSVTNQYTSFLSRPTNTSVLYCIRYKPAFMADNEGMLELEAEINAVRQKTVTVKNLLATEEGHPLDATQGKVLNDKITSFLKDFIILRTFSSNNSVTIGAYQYYSNYSMRISIPDGYKYLAMVDFECERFGEVSWVNAYYSNGNLVFLMYNHTSYSVSTGTVRAKVLLVKDI